MRSPSLDWLPRPDGALAATLSGLVAPDASSWDILVQQAATRLEPMGVLQLDRCLRRLFVEAPVPRATPVRLAFLGTSTLDHLIPALRVGALRHGLWLQVQRGEYGQCMLSDTGLTGVDTVLLAFDARSLLSGLDAGASVQAADDAVVGACDRIVQCWRDARTHGCMVIQQAILPVFPDQFGNNEHRLPGSRAAAVEVLNAKLRHLADIEGVHLVAIDRHAARDGLAAWHDPVLWFRAKQDIHLGAAAMYGELVARLLSAGLGRSRKALVLDLDNTLWGGVIGDDGLDGIILGQGSALGEAFVDVQHYAHGLSRRGVILAVCSKNDEANALEAFDRHPDMVLRRSDIACFVANWSDKATNLRTIAARLNIATDALVFLDDNPAERAIVRQELPEVAVPELPDDPAGYASCLADAGYFESLKLSDEDLQRTRQYQANNDRAASAAETDIEAHLASLDMILQWSAIDPIGAPRVVQLVNKTNQFNLTTRRTTEAAIAAVMADPAALSLQLRLQDRFGNNGLIAVVMGVCDGDAVHITDWLMSCRVLKRGVEDATLALIVGEGRRLGARRLVGCFRPTAKNGMVHDLYERLGFHLIDEDEGGVTRWQLDLDRAAPLTPPIRFDPPLMQAAALEAAQ